MENRRNLKKGFTLVETLVTVIILLILTAVATRVISTAVSNYREIVDGANAQLLLSTTISELRDELTMSTEISCDEDNGYIISYTSSRTGDINTISNSANGLWLTEYSGDEERLLVSRHAANMNLKCSYETAAYENGIITISGLKVKRGDLVLAELDEYKVKAG